MGVSAVSTTTKERLVAAARDHFVEVGAAHFSLREVARATGVSAAAVYRHFDDKEALLEAVYAEGFRVFASYLFASLSEPEPLARLRAAGNQYLAFGLERQRDYRAIFMRDASPAAQGGARTPAAGGSVAVCLPDPTFQFLVDRVRDCVDAQVFAPVDPQDAAVTIWGHVHGLVALRLSGHLAAVGDDGAFRALFREGTERLLESFRR
jgi:AcrR family transcriptional regulator